MTLKRNPEQEKAIVEAYATGEVIGSIAKRFGINLMHVHRIARRHGLPQRCPGLRRSSSYPAAIRLAAVRLYANKALSIGEIAERFGCSKSTIHEWVKRYAPPRQ